MEDKENFFAQRFSYIPKASLIKNEINHKKYWSLNNERIKVIKLNKKTIKEVLDKRFTLIETMWNINSPNIQKFIGYSKNNKGNLLLLFEKIKGKLLREALKNIDLNEKLVILTKIAEMIAEIHSKNLYLVEFTMSQIFLTCDHTIKIKYFSYFKRNYINSLFHKQYSINPDKIFYESPDSYDDYLTNDEVLLNQRRTVWAFGCLVSEMISLIKPWNQLYSNCLHIEALLIDKTPFPIPEIFNDEIYNKYRLLIENCTQIDGELRISIQDVHHYLKEINLN
jgi:serine/threonine protein kinase